MALAAAHLHRRLVATQRSAALTRAHCVRSLTSNSVASSAFSQKARFLRFWAACISVWCGNARRHCIGTLFCWHETIAEYASYVEWCRAIRQGAVHLDHFRQSCLIIAVLQFANMFFRCSHNTKSTSLT